MKRIAIDLNHDGTLSPQPREGRSQSWAHSSVRHILLNERYRGVVLWEKTRKAGSPKGTRVYQHRPQSEWRRVEIPGATHRFGRALESAAQTVETGPGSLWHQRRKAPRARCSVTVSFTGLLECSECGGSITIVSGRCRKRGDSRYGCSMHAQRGDSVCRNNLLIRRLDLERQPLAGLCEQVLHPDVVAYTLKRFEEKFAKTLAARRQGDADLSRQAVALERSIANQLRRTQRRIFAGNYSGNSLARAAVRRSPRASQDVRSRDSQVADA